MRRITIYNAQLILSDKIISKGYLTIDGNKIIRLGAGEYKQSLPSEDLIDAAGNFVSPGFIDIHVHGGGNSDFMDGTVEAYLNIAETHVKYGTTSLLPTTLTSTREELLNTFSVYKQSELKNNKGAQFLGLHLEGPYFSYNQRGAQDPKYLKTPRKEDYLEILSLSDDILRWSIAPELKGAMELGKELKSRGIIASVAHTDAICEEVIEAFDNGYSLMTHLYSAMSSVTRKNAYRYAGALEAAYLLDDMDVEIIADGIHLPKSLLQFVCKFKNWDRIALVTDAMRGAGMPDGKYMLGSIENGQEVLVEDGVAKLPDRTAFAGSVATADRLVGTMVQIAGIPLTDAIKMVTYNPARMLNIHEEKGSLSVGKDADIVIFNKDIDILMTIVAGRIIYKK
jgi:N-acetylglucosamine-6-phosphate deacetylase